MFVVTYTGVFGYIKPSFAVRDSSTCSQKFLTPSILEGIEKKLFPELLKKVGIYKIKRHKLDYQDITYQQETIQAKAWKYNKRKGEYTRETSIITRGILLYPKLYLAFDSEEDANNAAEQTVCLCRNEDLLFPEESPKWFDNDQFSRLKGLEFVEGESPLSIPVGYNRYSNKQMIGYIQET